MEDAIILEFLMKKYNYPHSGSKIILSKIHNFSVPLRTEFELWMNTGSVPEITTFGYSFTELINDHQMNPIAAFLTIDWLIKDPEKAINSLQKGHDGVIL